MTLALEAATTKPLFVRAKDGTFAPDPIVRGPFDGMQGGTAAALMCSQIEAAAAMEGWGFVASITTHFLRPVPVEPLAVVVEPLRRGKRVNIVDAHLSSAKGPCALARATLIGHLFNEATPMPPPEPRDPTQLPSRNRAAPHGQPWLMDAMEARGGEDGTAWFRLLRPVVSDAGPMSTVLPAADWAHGVAPPLGATQPRLAAIPNPDVAVHLFRAPAGAWIALEAASAWSKEGIGVGWAALSDSQGLIGRVAMSVAVSLFGASAL
jgi:hypothetical protein